MMMTLITGIIGIAMLLSFIGVMIWWVKAVPLIIIFLITIVMMLYDFVRTLRAENNP